MLFGRTVVLRVKLHCHFMASEHRSNMSSEVAPAVPISLNSRRDYRALARV
ncbi:hypothetical protein ABIE78_001832 [Sinorhizobium fredii]|jgi:hypothetical protein